ncbi:hypothetical protein MC7420_941 [Coleofasciculus chthonoplastes PCC 7420]|uniref:Uncharacterized protein n=1 Tax=Coleofasciculus chthonoplastes PCC 7420 TaxID=118168 RepID=B4W0B3_9CYAN|nr:hypothetical protein [Coleofasciculus chthonoplastes]EDX72272.1 hypothetical protein MC7420_941 [Coleofasciculus chthonoplastes PCC 7420]
MAIWIVTIGSSDVQLDSDKISKKKGRREKQRSDKMWRNWYDYDILGKFHNITFELKQIDNHVTQPYRIEPRVLGTVYQYHSPQIQEEIWSYLNFPLLDTFVNRLKAETDQLDQIIVLLTDQSQIFSDYQTQHQSTCPYWQDTHPLQPILARYFQGEDKFPQTPCEWIDLAPNSNDPGLDEWDYVLDLVRNELDSLPFTANPNPATSQTVYVSHQASTPAISSAVQFMSLARFGKRVQFLVSNEYHLERPANIISNSQYLRGIQVQQAKGLIQSGTPGAALHLLELAELKGSLEASVVAELEKLVDFFNLNRSLADKSSEFDLKAATARIVDGIALIERLFEQENYLPGIALLAAAQETFLRCAIMTEIQGRSVSLSINGTQQRFPAEDLIQWLRRGLQFVSTDDLKHYWSVSGSSKEEVNKTIKTLKLETLKQLQFPIDDNRFKRQPNQIGKNEFMLKWLRHLRSDFQPWKVLHWSCIQKNEAGEHDDDIRNQLMHNLQGMKPEDVVKYLLGNQERDISVIQAYQTEVKPQFMAAIRLCGLPFTEPKLTERLQGVADAMRIKSS